MAKNLDAVGCKFKHVQAIFKHIWAYTVGKYIPLTGIHWTSTINPSDEEIAEAKEHNKKQMKDIDDATEKHRSLIKNLQPELAIEMVTAHGGASEGFGFWALSYTWNMKKESQILRGPFHSGNYEAAKGGRVPAKKSNVCAWFVFDSSCFSGLTPKAVDTLNNTGKADFTETLSDSCDLHAGYERDISISTATTGAICHT